LTLPAELNEKKERFQLLDVREPGEWRAGRIDSALHIPLAQLPSRVGELDRTKPVATIWRRAQRRSGRVAPKPGIRGREPRRRHVRVDALGSSDGRRRREAQGGLTRLTERGPWK
jgi:hypothetical protein